MDVVVERVGNVTRERYEQIVAEARALVAQVARAQFSLGDKALEIEPMRSVGGSVAKGTDDLFTVGESLALFADDIGVAAATVEDWRWTASRWPAARRRGDLSFTVHRVLASITDDDERWSAIVDPPLDERVGRRRWTNDTAKRRVGHRVERPVTTEEKVRVVTDLTRDEDVARRVTTDLLRRPAAAEGVGAEDRVRVVAELTRDDAVAQQVTSELLRRPAAGRCATTPPDSWSTGPSSTIPRRPARRSANASRQSGRSNTAWNTSTWSGRAISTWPRWAGWSRGCGARSSPRTNVRPSAAR
ncbi:hypothetical protein GT354_01550 [Streptomyces sp. SID3343]|nr:hypothetical protein [Streptomyces sp. SID3343]